MDSSFEISQEGEFVKGDLNDVIGLPISSDQKVDEALVIRKVRWWLSRRSTNADFEINFAVFNALTLMGDFEISESCLDNVDSLLADYVKRCRKATGADTMLCDLIVDHWPLERALDLAREILIGPYLHRLATFIAEVKYHRWHLRAGFATGLLDFMGERTSKLSSRRQSCFTELALLLK